MSFLIMALTGVFALVSLLLIGIILIQEPKGGGLSEAFGGVGGETFGHKASGANKITWTLAAVWVLAAVAHHTLAARETGSFGSLRDAAPVQATGVPGPGDAPPIGPVQGPVVPTNNDPKK